MPRPQQTYGKRSRATYDPFAIFASPQRPQAATVNICEDSEVTQLSEQIGDLKLYQEARHGRCNSGRVALGERSANVGSKKQVLESEKSRRRRVKKVVEQVRVEEAEEKVQQQVLLNDAETAGKGAESEVVLEAVDSKVEEQTPCVDEEATPPADENPQDNEAETIVAEPASASPQTTALIRAKDLDHTTTQPASSPHQPSIAILPPTPTEEPDIYTTHCSSLLDLSSHPLSSFPEWSNQLSAHFSLTKIAEASFGEVYRLSLLERLPGFSRSDESVFKVIALKPPPTTLPTDKKRRKAALRKAEAMSKPEDVANEVRLLQRMSSIPGFTNFRDVRLLLGRPSGPFLSAFKNYNTHQRSQGKDLSIFPDPSKKSSYTPTQLWAVIEMQDAGTDLERLVERGDCTGIWSVWDVFWQVVLSLAKGEEGAEFEHRDLHLGNICVRSPPPPSTATAPPPLAIDPKRKLGFTSIETTIIDYTISRCRIPSPDHPGGTIAFHDLSLDSSLFEGDSSEEYQYDIYRYMRGAALLSHPLADFSLASTVQEAAEAGRSWEEYHPVTNCVWLHFVLYKLLEQVSWPSAIKAPARKRKEEHAVWKRANDLEHKLLKIQSLLDPEVLCKDVEGVESASDIVGLALTEGWLDEADIMGGDGEVEAEAGVGSDELVDELTHLQLNIDDVEQYGLDFAEQEARAGSSRKTRRE